MSKHNILEVQMLDFVKTGGIDWMERNVSFFDLQVLTKILFKWGNISEEDLWNIYNSENKEYITNMPLIKEFLKDCSTDEEIKELFKSLTKKT